MPTKITRYKCDFCKKNYATMGGAKRHEKVCFHNPANKSCVTCVEKYNKQGHWWCSKIDQALFVRMIVDCPYWESNFEEVLGNE